MDTLGLASVAVPAANKVTTDWSALRGGVQLYLEQQGVPPARAERFSHEIVVLCASEGDGADWDGLYSRAMSEAETCLLGWRAAGRPGLRKAA